MNPVLSATGLYKSFAGLAAVADFSIELHKGQIHALIGPNGAGKSTAIHLLSGELDCDQGVIELNGHTLTSLSIWQRAQAGLAQSFQITSVINELSVLDNMLIALLAKQRQSQINLRALEKQQHLISQAEQQLKAFALDKQCSALAGTLAHGEQGRLEIAMCLATRPSVLLLDEPMSGMSIKDGKQMIELLHTLKTNTAILLVEHDMDAVFELADTISVMAEGRIIAVDTPCKIKSNQRVIDAYLGT